MATPILAYIVPIETGNVPAHPIAPGGPPPTVWPPPGGPVFPAHPIAPGGPPPSVWPPPGVVSPPIHYPPEIWPTPPPSGGAPPGIWGGGNVPMPTPPIYYPPGQPVIPPGSPAHPIVVPPEPTEPPSGGEGKWLYSPIYGWVWQPAGSGGKPQPPA
jgi:hypothetical protein